MLLLAPRYWPAHVAVLLAMAGAVLLGLWQLDVWHGHRTSASQGLSHAAPVPLSRLITGDSAFPRDGVGVPVRVTGHWLPLTVYVDRRTDAQQPGYWVVSLLAVDGTKSAIPVVRGTSSTPHASGLGSSSGASVDGWLEPSESSDVPDPNLHDDVLPDLQVAALVQRTPVDLYSGFVISRTPAAGLVAARPTLGPGVSFFTGLRNFVYALQWWVFGGFAVFVWWRWCRDQLVAERVGPSTGSGTDGEAGSGTDGEAGSGAEGEPGSGAEGESGAEEAAQEPPVPSSP